MLLTDSVNWITSSKAVQWFWRQAREHENDWSQSPKRKVMRHLKELIEVSLSLSIHPSTEWLMLQFHDSPFQLRRDFLVNPRNARRRLFLFSSAENGFVKRMEIGKFFNSRFVLPIKKFIVELYTTWWAKRSNKQQSERCVGETVKGMNINLIKLLQIIGTFSESFSLWKL